MTFPLFFVRLSLANPWSLLGFDLPVAANFSLNPLLRLLFFALWHYWETLLFLDGFGYIFLRETGWLLRWQVLLPTFLEAPRWSSGSCSWGFTDCTVAGIASLGWCLLLICRLTFSDRPTYPQGSNGHLTMEWRPWLLNESNIGYNMGFCFILDRCCTVSYLKWWSLWGLRLALIARLILYNSKKMLLILTTLSLLTLETHGVLGFWGNDSGIE